jgi:hypothetical protein
MPQQRKWLAPRGCLLLDCAASAAGGQAGAAGAAQGANAAYPVLRAQVGLASYIGAPRAVHRGTMRGGCNRG